MGTIAARDCIRILELTEQVAAALLIATVQGLELRGQTVTVGDTLQFTMNQMRNHVPFLQADRALESELRVCVDLIRQHYWSLYD